MATAYGHFCDAEREFVVTDPLTPAPWINYLGNTRLTAFISQQAGGLVFYRSPQTRRLTRYHYLATPQDRPGFYLYVRDRTAAELWNPHFAPVCLPLDAYQCRHGLGYTLFTGSRRGVETVVRYFIPPDDDIFLWDVTVTNRSAEPRDIELASYVEFGLLEFMKETLGWCYDKNQTAYTYDAAANRIKYDYHVFEAAFTPAVFMSCTEAASGFDCSRAAFCGRGGSLERPLALLGAGLTGSELPAGGDHGCGVLGARMDLQPGRSRRLAYMLGIADTWPQAECLRRKYDSLAAVDAAFAGLASVWRERTGSLQASTGDIHVDRSLNIWNPLNIEVALERGRDISTDHIGLTGMRFRDTMQDALAGAIINPGLAWDFLARVFSAQSRDGRGFFQFFPFDPLPIEDRPMRSDNTVWPIYTVGNLVCESGDPSYFHRVLPFRDGGEASVFDHILLGLKYIYGRLGRHGLPILDDADWNDFLSVFGDPRSESVMLGMQLVYSAKELARFARILDRPEDEAWCDRVAAELDIALNSDAVWDGRWYRRLLLTNGVAIGSAARPQGQIFLNPQSWSVIAGVGRDGRGQTAMDEAHARLNTSRGLLIHAPPYTGIPNPEDPLPSNNPGVGENGGIFCHANAWAIIAQCLLGNGDRAFSYYRRLLPSVAAEEMGYDHWRREPYAFVSAINGPACGADFGRAGISWLTGTASWIYIAATQYILGIRPELNGLRIKPCLPSEWDAVRVRRRFRRRNYTIEMNRVRGSGADDGRMEIKVDGRALEGGFLKV